MDIPLSRRWISTMAALVREHCDHLTRLDAAVGDADHGQGMNRGFATVSVALAEQNPSSIGELLISVSCGLVSAVGGASGPLYGGAFRGMGAALPGPTATTAEFGGALAAGLESLQRIGAAVPGEMTMVDAFAPAAQAFGRRAAAGASFTVAARAAADAADAGALSTVSMQARKGRASYLGPRSIGHQDPGATSTALLFQALAAAAAHSAEAE